MVKKQNKGLTEMTESSSENLDDPHTEGMIAEKQGKTGKGKTFVFSFFQPEVMWCRFSCTHCPWA